MARLLLSGSRWMAVAVMMLLLLAGIPKTSATTYLIGTDANGVQRNLTDDRTPALYTGDFGDCLGGESLINVTQFDAAYYSDNRTVLFHLAGTTSLRNASIIIYISVFAYGEDRFDYTYDPCGTENGLSLCPLNAGTPVAALAIIPVSTADVAGIIPIALQIPDFEGSASIRIFSNTTKTEVACFQAVMRNGASFSQPAAVGSILGIFTTIAMISSFAVAIYGVSLTHIRLHYAHSVSVLVVFEVFQSIFFSGALNLNWPSVLPAWWSNFAWSAGMIYSSSMTNSVNKFLGQNLGNSSQVGGAGSSTIDNNGGIAQQIYGRSDEALAKRAATGPNITFTGYSWSGGPVEQGLPVPGNWSGFPGELSLMQIPASDAFLTGFLWLLILLLILAAATVAFKWLLEGFRTLKWIAEDRLVLFRSSWLGVLALVLSRTLFIAFPMMMILTMFQFSFKGPGGVTAIAALVFIVFFVGGLATAGYACFYRLRFGHIESTPDKIHFGRTKFMIKPTRESNLTDVEKESVKGASLGSVPFFRIRHIDSNAERQNAHEDQTFLKRFGWLSARFRKTRWWFFAFWVVYQFVRACFIGGGSAHPEAQVVGLFIVEIIAFIAIVWMNPFEGSRNTALAVYMLGISKVATAGLSIAFLPSLNLARIPTTVVGIIIIVIQGFLTIGLMILILIGAVSSYFSINRNREAFIPRTWDPLRIRYFEHLENPHAKKVAKPVPPKPLVPKEPYFNVGSVRRAPKIEDEDEADEFTEMSVAAGGPAAASTNPTNGRESVSRTNSIQGHVRSNSMRSNYSAQGTGYGNVPYGARVHRMSWSSKDFGPDGIAALAKEGGAGDASPVGNKAGSTSRRSTLTQRPRGTEYMVRSQGSNTSLNRQARTAPIPLADIPATPAVEPEEFMREQH